MNLSLYIATRYLFSRKSYRVINIISAVAVAGVALATVAMVCTLSVFNGFSSVVERQFTAFDPDIKITSAQGKVFDASAVAVDKIKSLPYVKAVTESVEDKAMVQYGGRQVMVTVKGVQDNFDSLTDINSVLIGNGSFRLRDSIADYAVMGAELTSSLNCGIYFVQPLEIYAPKRGVRVSLTNPASNFKKGLLHASGVIFALNQPKYDANYILTSIEFARDIFDRGANEVGSLEIGLAVGADSDRAKRDIQAILGDGFNVHDRYEQQLDIFRIMEIEKFISYIFLSFILFIACFNIIGSLSMVIIEKRADVATLRSMGADDRLVTNIFIIEGVMVSLIGALSGVVVGIGLCLAQQHWNLLGFGTAADGFIVDGYPVRVVAGDIVAILLTVVVVGVVTVGVPVQILSKRLLRGS